MEANPSCAKQRISSSPSHGFFSRFRRSARCALVSRSVFAIKVKNPPPALFWRWVINAETKRFLNQHFPARRHQRTTTSASAHPAELGKRRHNVKFAIL